MAIKSPKSTAFSAKAITLSDTTDQGPVDSFMVATKGDLKVTTVNGETVTLPALIPGYIYPISVQRFWSTGSGATGVIGLT